MVCSFSVSCDKSNLKQIRDFIQKSFGRSVIDVQDRYNITCAIDEFCANIIEHTSTSISNKRIYIKTLSSTNTFCVEIYDTGEAFDCRNVQCPSIESIVTNKMAGGMGINLIQNLSDGHTIEKRGNGVTVYRFFKYARKQAV